ncbi:MAG: PhoH family protein [Planctomycetota bacterium]
MKTTLQSHETSVEPSSNPVQSAKSPGKKRKTSPKPAPKTGVKTFVLDTNVILHNPQALFVFQDNNVVIPFTVLEELDRFKSDNDDRGRNAREAIRYLDRLRTKGRLIDGVTLGNGQPAIDAAAGYKPTGTLRIDMASPDRPLALREDKPDNRIIGVAHGLHAQGERVVFVSKDINCRIKSDALGIRTEDFENQKVDVDHLYTGYLTLRCDGALIDELYAERMLPLETLWSDPVVVEVFGEPEPAEDDGDEGARTISAEADIRLSPNQYVVLIDATDESHTGLARRLADTDHLIPVNAQRKPTFGIMPRNVQQTMALDLLLDDEVKMVTLIGSAGTGKTLLAVAAGMTKVYTEKRYEKMLVARPIMPMGRDIGYLPGDKDEKLTAWMQPIFDNLAYLLSTRGSHLQAAESLTTEQRIDKLLADGQLVLEPLTYIRGRSIPHQFIIIDEAQNLSPHEVKTIVSRVGESTKIIFTGDIEQIDNPYLDSSSNGLSYLVDRMKGLGVVGHISLAKSERSHLASLATERL